MLLQQVTACLLNPFATRQVLVTPKVFFISQYHSINPTVIQAFARIVLLVLIECFRNKLVFRIFQRTAPPNEACIFKVTFETYFPPKPPEDLNGSTTISQVKVSTNEGVNGSLEETVTFLV